MKKTMLTLAAVILVATACKKTEETPPADAAVAVDTIAVADETAEAAQPMDSAAMMKAWEAYATPGDPHKMLAAESGNWSAESTMYMSANDPNPMKMAMTSTTKMVMGGRYQESRYSGNMMGQPFEGLATVGYNNASKKFESNWIDNMGTGVMQMSGEYDAATKTINLAGECMDPMTGKTKKMRETWKIVDDNTRKMTLYDTDPSGKEFKSMEIVQTRKK
ncbi:DUF1579 domain-containing protein [Flavobacterium caeni]|uniref:DUF1579 domain-containing protein n=1 Tax=Flavobacterium caeni TaxID=490189 RepID=A0A1G5IJ71_9FLAO|nr:DUF1579 domain-containing protein [Flavobacterium caeni]SCY75468.1 Protein of unknown function [Flavobacterium caeni]